MRIGSAPRTQAEAARESLLFYLEQSGVDPSGFFDSLDLAIRGEAWRDGGFGSLAEFIQAPVDEGGVGATVEQVKAILALKHRYEDNSAETRDMMVSLRAAVLDGVIPPLGTIGKNQYGSDGCNNVTPSTRGNSPEYVVARLKRDGFEELAEKVLTGQVSANAAAVEAGFRKRTIQIPSEPSKAAAALRRHFAPEELRALVSELADMIDWKS